jgi:hypothetical protein
LIPALCICAAVSPLSAQILGNGGFESDLSEWSSATVNGSSATFTLTNAKVHSGSKALRVDVATAGLANNSVVLSHTAFSSVVNRLYILRFWALAAQRNAILDINLKGATRNSECHFQVYDSLGAGWQMYQYCFNADETPLSLELKFNAATTYYLDDVEIVDETDPVIDVSTQYMWQTFLNGWGWVSGDNDVSVPLPDGRIAWILNDSFLGTPNDHTNVLSEGTMINNLIVVQEGLFNRQLRSVFAGSQAAPVSLFKPATAGAIYWICDGIIENGKLKVMLQEWKDLSFSGKAAVATVSLPELSVENITETAYHGSDIPYAILEEADYNYIYTVERAGPFEVYSRVARVPRGNIGSTEPWEFYSTDDSWSSDFAKAKRIIPGVEASSVVKLGPENYVLSGVPHLSDEIAVWFAQSPVGPWTNKTVIAKIPREEGVLAYMGHIHEGTEHNGIYTLSYSIYPFGGGVPQQLSDKTIYVPYYVKADLKKLSPFSPVSTKLPLAPHSPNGLRQGRCRVEISHSESDRISRGGGEVYDITGRKLTGSHLSNMRGRVGVFIVRQTAQPAKR